MDDMMYVDEDSIVDVGVVVRRNGDVVISSPSCDHGRWG